MRAVDLPELRAELASFADSEEGASYWNDHASTVDYYQATATADGDYLGNVVRDALNGDLYAVSGPMAELAATAGQSLGLFDMEVQDLPTPTGVLIFEQPPQLLHGPDEDGTPLVIHGATWAARDDGEGGFVWITPIAEMGGHSHLLLGGPALLPFSMADYLASIGRSGLERDKNLFDHLITTMRAAWLLMQQPLAETSDMQPDRAVRKRLRRIAREPAAVRLIELRRPKSSGGPGDGDREYHHQWIVRGHWRQQWYPARQVHRPVWIAPHIKGPEGAPLLGGEKVNFLKR